MIPQCAESRVSSRARRIRGGFGCVGCLTATARRVVVATGQSPLGLNIRTPAVQNTQNLSARVAQVGSRFVGLHGFMYHVSCIMYHVSCIMYHAANLHDEHVMADSGEPG